MSMTMRSFPLFVIVALAACGGGESGAPPAQEVQPAAEAAAPAVTPPPGATAEMVAQGKTIFSGAGLCHTCHTAEGTGGALAPNLTDDQWLNVDGSYEAIINLVMTGVPQPKQHPGIMLPKGGSTITDEEVRAVAAYVWTLGHAG